jgi:hypothetical protein
MRRRRFLGSALAAPVVGLAAALPLPVRPDATSGLRRLRFTLTFANPHAHALEAQSFWCYLPANLPPVQRLRGLQVSAPHSVQTDALGHRILALSFEHFPPLGQKIVTVTAEVDCAPSPGTDLTASESDFVSRQYWLGAERFVESDSDEIRALAGSLRRAADLATTRAIYDWVRGNLSYAGYVAEDLGALSALKNRRGDCTEYADLVVALARANGIPARMVGGYVTDRDVAPRPKDYHNWAEVYLEGTWRIVDAQKENWLVSSAGYIVFRLYRDVAINPIGLAHRYRLQGELGVTF